MINKTRITVIAVSSLLLLTAASCGHAAHTAEQSDAPTATVAQSQMESPTAAASVPETPQPVETTTITPVSTGNPSTSPVESLPECFELHYTDSGSLFVVYLSNTQTVTLNR